MGQSFVGPSIQLLEAGEAEHQKTEGYWPFLHISEPLNGARGGEIAEE